MTEREDHEENVTRWQKFRLILRELSIDLCTVHGLPHIIDAKKPWHTRIFWGVLLTVFLLLFVYYSFLTSWKFWIDPDISLNFGFRPMHELAFPAVTICSPTFSHDSSVNFTEVLENPGNFTTELIANAQWCDMKSTLKALNASNDRSDRNILKIMSDSQLKLNEFMFECSYRTKPVECSKLFTRVLTDFGYCFTYNMQDHHAIFNEIISEDFDDYGKFDRPQKIQWTLDEGFKVDSDNVFPRRATRMEDVVVNLKVPVEFNASFCDAMGQGLNVFFHLPNELVTSLKHKPYFVNFNEEQSISISAKSIRAKDEVRRYPPLKRNCFFEGERDLKYFKQYTEPMCRLECLTNYTLETCNCVKFSMPREDKTRICQSYEEVACLINATDFWSSHKTSKTYTINPCDCLFTCRNAEYFVRFKKRNALVDSVTKVPIKLLKNGFNTRFRLQIFDHDIEEDLKVCSYNSVNYIADLGGLTGLFTGCSIISLLELAFFVAIRYRLNISLIIVRYLKRFNFLNAPVTKNVKIMWSSICLLVLSGLGFYIFEIIRKYQIDPPITEEIGQILKRDIPFPAITVCSPYFGRNHSVDLLKFLKNPNQTLTAEEQSEFAANIQACAPYLGSTLSDSFALADNTQIIEILKSKFSSYAEALTSCGVGGFEARCDDVFSYVLTDHGFCFTFNLEDATTIFNEKVISKDFECYSRQSVWRGVNQYYNEKSEPWKLVNERNREREWTLEGGYRNNSKYMYPSRAIRSEIFQFVTTIRRTDPLNLCPENGIFFLLYFHMPNEIMTPLHVPEYIYGTRRLTLDATYHQVDGNLRHYSPEKRECYFDGEKQLKFFKSYTKSHCEFECMANFTLEVCGCVKFSMPRDDFTPVCNLNQASCYVKTMKEWNKSAKNCACLHSCTYIDYSIKNDRTEHEEFLTFPTPYIQMEIFFDDMFALKNKKSAAYSFYKGLADFGSILGVFFGVSVISLVEIFYFIFTKLFFKKFVIQLQKNCSEFANESTIHGVQFIFNRSLHKGTRVFWALILFLALSGCIYNAQQNYKKLAIEPEIEMTQQQKSLEEVPFPAITICTPIFGRRNTSLKLYYFVDYPDMVTQLTQEQWNYIAANLYWSLPEAFLIRKIYNELALNETDPWNYRSNIDLAHYLNRSHYEIDEMFEECTFRRKVVNCSDILRRVMTPKGICYTYNMEGFHTIFKEEISKNFDSYGRYEKEQEQEWTLDEGYKGQYSEKPVRAAINNEVSFILDIKRDDLAQITRDGIFYNFFLHLPNQIISPMMQSEFIRIGTEMRLTLSAKSKKSSEKLRSFLPENRGCYFQNERKLNFFEAYTKSNCEIECFVNYTNTKYGCVSYILPHNDSATLCDSPKDGQMLYEMSTDFPISMNFLCGCLPTCNSVEYSKKSENSMERSQPQTRKNKHFTTRLQIQFEDTLIIEEEVFVTYGFREFITDVGGLLGLFLGCSMLSLMELIYYPVMTFVKYFRRVRSQSVEIKEVIEAQNSIAIAAFMRWKEFKQFKAKDNPQTSQVLEIITEQPGMVIEEVM